MPSRHSKKTCLIASILAFCLMACVSGCAGGGGTEVGNAGASTFKSRNDLESYLKDQFSKSILPASSYNSKVTAPDYGNAALDQAGSTPSFSGTNTQEKGADESDKVKTDGNYLYIAADRSVAIVDTRVSSDMRVVSKIPVNGTLGELYLSNGLLTVIYDSGQNEIYMDFGLDLKEPARIGFPFWIPLKSETNIAFYDVSIPSDPKLIISSKLDGDLVSTRIIDGKLHVIQQFLPELPQLELDYDGTEDGWKKSVANNTRRMESMTLNDMLPSYSTYDKNGNLKSSGILVEPTNFFKLDGAEGSAIVTITSFDLSKPDQQFKSVGIVATADTIYASTKAIYLAAPEWDYDESYAENTESTTGTIIHKFDLSTFPVRHVASGSVKGAILNQFSMGEYKDVLRVATTEYRWNQSDGSSAGSSNVYCLKGKNSKLDIIGKIENIAPGENMYSARFSGSKGFLVTFERIDPLHTIDLSDPEHPFIAGELKIPGYSEYIHPLDDGRLISIGRDVAEVDGRLVTMGLQLSMFDITDFSNPRLLHKKTIGSQYTYSEASYNHKAFNFWAEKNLLSIPVTESPAYTLSDGRTGSSKGLYVFKVSNQNGFDLKGIIDTGTGSDFYFEDWTRGIFIEDRVLAVCPQSVFSAEIENIGTTVDKIGFNF